MTGEKADHSQSLQGLGGDTDDTVNGNVQVMEFSWMSLASRPEDQDHPWRVRSATD